MTIKYERKIMLLMATAIIGFAALPFLYPANVYASDRYYEEEMYENIEDSQEMAEEIENRQRDVMSELEKLKAETQISRESIVDTTTGPQSYFENDLTPEITNGTTNSGDSGKVYKYEQKTGASAPPRLFNNVR